MCNLREPSFEALETGGSQLERKTSRTRSTLRRITSFMRKDKSKNLSLVDTDGPASLKYSRYCPLCPVRVMICQQTCKTCWRMLYSFHRGQLLASSLLLKVEHLSHTYPLDFLLYMTWHMTVVCYKVNYLPVGIRIWFWPNCRIRVFGDMAKFSSEIG